LYSRYYDSILDVDRKVLLGINVYVTLEKDKENMEIECTFIIAMKNG
jgi:hypothetical protein